MSCKWVYMDGLRGAGGLGNAADLVDSLRRRPLPAYVAAPLCTCPPSYVRPALTQSLAGIEMSDTVKLVGVAVVAVAIGGFFAWMDALA